MPRGPKPKPDAVKSQKAAVRSTRAARDLPAVASPALAAGEPPSWLKKDGLAIWNRLAPTLRAAKLLSEADVLTFARYCRNFARWLDMQKAIDKGGEVYEIETASGKVRRADPHFLIGDRIERMLLAFEDRFGLNPAERQRIMAARINTGAAGDLFAKEADKRKDDAAAPASEPAVAIENPVGMLQ